MDPAELFLRHLPLIEKVIDRVCRRSNVLGADAEDFSSQAKLALIEDDYAILKKWEGGSLPTFLAIVIQRLLVDEWRAHSRWVASAEARRLGPAAVALETLLARDGRPLAEAIERVAVLHPSVSRAELARLAAALPHREPPKRTVPMPEYAPETLVARQSADERAREHDVARVSDRAGRLVRGALASMDVEDRMLLRFRFASSMTIADIARVMDKPQRPLYRRLESLLASLRQSLAEAGLDSRALADVIGAPAAAIDFGWKSDEPMPSPRQETTGTAAEQ